MVLVLGPGSEIAALGVVVLPGRAGWRLQHLSAVLETEGLLPPSTHLPIRFGNFALVPTRSF
jgi:hypothetical protein